MPDLREQASRLLQLPPAAYFELTEERQADLQSALSDLAGESTPPAALLVLGAPAEVDPAVRASVPVFVGSVQTALRAWQVNFRTNLTILLRDMSTGELQASAPLEDMRRGRRPRPSGAGTPPEPRRESTFYSAVQAIDLRARMARPILPGHHRVTALAYDLRSNTVGIRLLDAKPGGAGPGPALPPTVGSGAPAVARSLIDVPARATAQGPVMMRAAFQITANAGVLNAESSHATWPCHVLLITLDRQPIVVKLSLPLQRVEPQANAAHFNATLQLDLRAVVAEGLAGTYQVYFDAGSEVLGPYPMVIGD